MRTKADVGSASFGAVGNPEAIALRYFAGYTQKWLDLADLPFHTFALTAEYRAALHR